jgi:hypothetical protein
MPPHRAAAAQRARLSGEEGRTKRSKGATEAARVRTAASRAARKRGRKEDARAHRLRTSAARTGRQRRAAALLACCRKRRRQGKRALPLSLPNPGTPHSAGNNGSACAVVVGGGKHRRGCWAPPQTARRPSQQGSAQLRGPAPGNRPHQYQWHRWRAQASRRPAQRTPGPPRRLRRSRRRPSPAMLARSRAARCDAMRQDAPCAPPAGCGPRAAARARGSVWVRRGASSCSEAGRIAGLCCPPAAPFAPRRRSRKAATGTLRLIRRASGAASWQGNSRALW